MFNLILSFLIFLNKNIFIGIKVAIILSMSKLRSLRIFLYDGKNIGFPHTIKPKIIHEYDFMV